MSIPFREKMQQAMQLSVRFRFFVIEAGPVFDAIQKCHLERIAAGKIWKDFARSVGASSTYANNTLTGVTKLDPLPPGWKICADEPKAMVPDRKTGIGRAIAKTIAALPKAPSFGNCLGAFGLDDFPVICTGSTWYRLQVFAGDITKRPIVRVVWKDFPKDLIREYKKQTDSGNCELDFVSTWKPAKGMVEIKEFEALKIVDEDAKPAKRRSK